MLLFKRIKYTKYIEGYASAITGIIEYTTNAMGGLGDPDAFVNSPVTHDIPLVATFTMLLSCINRYTENPLSKPTTLLELRNAAESIRKFDKIATYKSKLETYMTRVKKINEEFGESQLYKDELREEFLVKEGNDLLELVDKYTQMISGICLDIEYTLMHIIIVLSDEYTMCKTNCDIIRDRFAPYKSKDKKIKIMVTPANQKQKGVKQ